MAVQKKEWRGTFSLLTIEYGSRSRINIPKQKEKTTISGFSAIWKTLLPTHTEREITS